MTDSSSAKCYVAGSLTQNGTNEDLLRLYERVGDVCRTNGFDVYLPHIAKRQAVEKRVQLSPETIFDWDISQLKTSKLVVAFIGTPSLGVGIELGAAAFLGIPIITFCAEGTQVSPMVLGHPFLYEHFFFHGEEDCIQRLTRSLRLLKSSA